MTRRSDLLDGALDYVLREGLGGLSLRPLAAALGTSDRMLVYHFGSKDQLVAGLLAHAQQRLADNLTAPGQDVRTPGDLVHHLWADLTGHPEGQLTRLYVEACLLAMADPAKWKDAPEHLRGPWREPLRTGLTALGVPLADVDAVATLVLDVIDGLALDRLSTHDPARVDAAAAMFASLLDLLVRRTPHAPRNRPRRADLGTAGPSS